MGRYYVTPHGSAEARCSSIEVNDHEFTQIKDMCPRIADLAAVLDALRMDAWNAPGALA